MEIKNKLESFDKINELGLNKFPEQLFSYNEKEKVKMFLNEYPAKYYAIRDKSKIGGVFKLKVEYDKVIEEIEEYTSFYINVSSAKYTKNQLLTGEIEILSTNEVDATLSTDPTASARSAVQNPTINIKTNIFDDDTLKMIPHFDYIYEYIIVNDLKDIIVEFALFDEKVGINKENIVIYELRTHY